MEILIIAIIFLALMIVVLVGAIKPETGRQKQLKQLGYKYVAHRGLHKKVLPDQFGNYVYARDSIVENTMPAFEAAIKEGFGIELDVHMTTDGRLVVFHDETLERLCNDPRSINKMSYEEVNKVQLPGIDPHIPLLENVLELIGGRVPLLVEIKPEGNYKETVRLTCEMLDNYDGSYMIQSFHPLVLRWLKKNRKKVLRGQLATNYKRNKMKTPPGCRWILSNMFLNFWARPDFISYNYHYVNHWGYWLIRKLFKPVNAAWTVRSKAGLKKAKEVFDIIIFDSFNPKEGK